MSYIFIIGLTPCQARQKLSTGLLGEFVPKCKSDGSFEPVQFHEGYYWCVDADGKEVNGTRKHLQQPTCAAQLKSGNSFKCVSEWSADLEEIQWPHGLFTRLLIKQVVWVQSWLLCCAVLCVTDHLHVTLPVSSLSESIK